MAIIAISRGTASGGRALADLVAKQLGYPCVSREEIANSKEWYGIIMETPGPSGIEPRSYWERLAAERTAHLDSFRTALCERARSGNLVYHGHEGHLLMPGIPILSVRVIADMEYRIESMMREQSMTREDAIAYINRVDEERREWVVCLYGVEWEDPSLYDVVLNLSHLSLDSACAIVVDMARLEEFRQTPQSLKAIEDLALRSRISAALSRDSRTAAAGLIVDMEDGVVTIGGTVRQEVLDCIPSVIGMIEGAVNVRYKVQVAAAEESRIEMS